MPYKGLAAQRRIRLEGFVENTPAGARQQKPPKVILIAVARKLLTILNAIVRDQTEWRSMRA